MHVPGTGDPALSRAGVSDLVMIALAQERRSGLSEMLRVIAEAANSAGCILWQETPHGLQLFVLADWFSGEQRSFMHNLSLLRSATGKAILEREIVAVDDVESDLRVDRHDPFLNRVCCFCSIPLTFLDGKRGALNTYRTVKDPFEPQTLHTLEHLTNLLPSLYETITDKISYRLVREVNQVLNTSVTPDDRPNSIAFHPSARRLCKSISDAFAALEVSLFLENSLIKPGQYRLAATTWPERRRFAKSVYTANIQEGLTGWVLATQKSVRIFDLAHFDRERTRLRSQYPDLIWKDSLKIESSVRRFLEVPANHDLQPVSFMAVPILAAGKLLGALRCCTAKSSPYHFSESDLKLLELVAAQIGQAWSNWLHRNQIEEENRTWKRLAASMRDLNLFVEQQVAQGNSNETQIFAKALEAANSVIPGAEISDVRLIDDQQTFLYFVAMHGRAWKKGSPSEIAIRRDRKFFLDEVPISGGAHVVRTARVYLISDTSDPKYHYSETFADARRMIIAPISVAGRVFGVLDIRSTGDRDFPSYAMRIAEILGQQLGLYHYLLQTFADLQGFQRIQAQTFEDFTHQLKSPIHQVHARIQICVRLAGQLGCSVEALNPHLFAIRGLSAKAKQVSQTLGLFADLALGKRLRPDKSRILVDQLLKTMIEAAIDQESTLDPERRLRFSVDREGFDGLKTYELIVDPVLLLQAVNNLLDNAAKYSSSGTIVTVRGGLTGTRRFQITILNQGIPITASDIRLSRSRGWRSRRAAEVTGEGSGIGLWLVDHIMKAHEGELLIIPTTAEGWTEVKLLFPLTPS